MAAIILSNLNAARYCGLAIKALVVMGFWAFILSVCSVLGMFFAVDLKTTSKPLFQRNS